jgi:hypothetical protein
MKNTKNYVTRLRLNKQIDFTEDFKTRFMTREYGNYDKYEKNSVSEDVEKGAYDDGTDNFHKNYLDMMSNVDMADNEKIEERERNSFEKLLHND